MTNPLSMFHDKDLPGEPWSMTRVVIFMFAATLCFSIVVMALHDHAHDIGKPFAAMAIATTFGMPLYVFSRMVSKYLESKPGRDLIARMIKTVVPGAAVAGTVESVITSSTTTTPAKPAGGEDEARS